MFRAAFVIKNKMHDLPEAANACMPVNEPDSFCGTQVIIDDFPKSMVCPFWMFARREKPIRAVRLPLQHLVLDVPPMLVEVGPIGLVGCKVLASAICFAM